MNAQLSIFNFQNHTVRIEIKDNDPLFCLTDIAEVLEITNPHATRFNLNPKGIHNMYTLTKGGKQELTFIDEANLYRVIFKSRKAEAILFQNWIFEEVIPTIRKTGNYGNQEKLERASKMAAVVAAQVSHDTFKAFMQGKDEELGGRWLVYTHWQNGKPEVGASPIPGSAHIATLEELADRLIKDPNPFEKPEHFAKLANACLQRLAAKAQYLAAK